MFEYEKKRLGNEIKRLEEKLDQKRNLEKEYDSEINRINSALSLNKRISGEKTCMSFNIVFSILSLAMIIITEIPIFFQICTVLGCGCISISGISLFMLMKKKKELKKYDGFNGKWNEKELYDRIETLKEENYHKAYCEQLNISNKIRNRQTELEQLLHYEKIVNFLKSPKGILLKASSKEEYDLILKIQTEYLTLWNQYLNESFDPAKVHFDNSIGEDIDYTENSKKLLKRR